MIYYWGKSDIFNSAPHYTEQLENSSWCGRDNTLGQFNQYIFIFSNSQFQIDPRILLFRIMQEFSDLLQYSTNNTSTIQTEQLGLIPKRKEGRCYALEDSARGKQKDCYFWFQNMLERGNQTQVCDLFSRLISI